MSHAQSVPAALLEDSCPPVSSSAETVSVPWTIWLMVAGITITLAGGTWDFAWHMSIGRDTLWTPPHILVQLGGLLVGIACAHAILSTTLASASAARAASVQAMAFHGPGGAFIAVWGCVAMLASEPFDNWWHNAYGLDVKIVTPPHVVLALGYFATQVGAMAWMASIMNRSMDALRGRLTWLFLFVGSIGVGQLSVMIVQATPTTRMHTAGFLTGGWSIYSFVVGCLRLGRDAQVGVHYRSRHLHCLQARFGMVAASLSRTTEARSGVPQRDTPDSAAVSAVADCSGLSCRRVVAEAGAAIILDQGSLGWAGFCARLNRRAVALREFSDVSGLTELDLRHCVFCLFGYCGISVRSL